MFKKGSLLAFTLLSGALALTGCKSYEEEYHSAQSAYEQAESNYQKEKEEKEKIIAEKKDSEDKLNKELTDLKKEYSDYKEKMKPYEGLEKEEAEARKIEAEKTAREEAERKAQEEKAAKEQKEAEEAAGYQTGITFDDLNRYPDKYKGKKVCFSGFLVQVVEEASIYHCRFAINESPDEIIFIDIPKNLSDKRLIQWDPLTIYGVSDGIFHYTSSDNIPFAIPYVKVDRIE